MGPGGDDHTTWTHAAGRPPGGASRRTSRRTERRVHCPPVLTLSIDDHPLLETACFVTSFPRSLGDCPSPTWLTGLLSLAATTPLASDDEVRKAARNLLRHGGYRPTGRGKPASEYLIRAAENGSLGPINLAVDACNVASLHSGLPISVVDLDLAAPPFRIGIASDDDEYVFNAAGQVIRLSGLLCLHDNEGPCANGVKDCQRTKTGEATARTLSVVWGTGDLPGRTEATVGWYRDLLTRAEATIEDITLLAKGTP